MAKIHELKILPAYFNAVKNGIKKFEVRKNDHNYKINDEILLKEWDQKKEKFTGKILHRKITYFFDGFGVEKGYCVLSLENI